MKKVYEVIVIGRSREVYHVEADSEDEARSRWQDEEPVLTEIDDAEVEYVGVIGDD